VETAGVTIEVEGPRRPIPGGLGFNRRSRPSNRMFTPPQTGLPPIPEVNWLDAVRGAVDESVTEAATDAGTEVATEASFVLYGDETSLGTSTSFELSL